MLRNECAWRPETEVRVGLLAIWEAMQQCVRRGCKTEGELPGLRVPRRAARLYRQLAGQPEASPHDPLTIMDWVNLRRHGRGEGDQRGAPGAARASAPARMTA